jgi:PAS domain S-box-containing protein
MGTKILISTKVPLGFFLIYLLILGGTFTSTTYIYQYQKSTIELGEKNLFVFVSNLKQHQIVTWREKRLSDAKDILANDFVKNGIVEYLKNNNNLVLKNRLSGWLESLVADKNYESISLLNNKLNIILSSKPPQNYIESFVTALCRQSLAENKILLSDFHKESITGNVLLYLFIPVKATDKKSGVFIFRINPYAELYPLLQSWPIPTKTAESIMVELRNDSVLSLSPLRRLKNAELNVKLPVSLKDLPAAKYIRGESGIIIGKDYSGSEVVAFGQKILSTSWYIITKIDTAELFEKINERLYFVISAALLFVIAVSFAFWYFLKKQLSYYQQLAYRTSEDKRTVEKYYAYLIKYANDIMFLLNESGNVIFSNERAVQVYGYTQDELLKLNIKDIRAENSWLQIEEQMKQAEKTGIVFETLHKRKDGSTFPVEVSSRTIEVNGKRYFQSIVRDISERKDAERKIYELNRTYSFLSDVNQIIVRTQNEKKLFEETCDIAVKRGGFKFAYIGTLNKKTGHLEIAAYAGDCVEQFDNISFNINDFEKDNLPAFTCFNTGLHYICNDIENDDSMEHFKEAAARNNYNSCAVFPIKIDNKTIGILNLYSEEKHSFNEAEIKLLDEMSGDVSYAVKSLKNEKGRKKFEKALLRSWERYKELFENNPNPMWIYDDKTLKFIDVNKTAINHYGYTKTEFLSMTLRDIRPKEDLSQTMDFFESTREDIRTSFNVRHLKKDGTTIYVEVKSNLITIINEQKYRIVSINDVTEQKRMMEEVFIAKEKAEEANKARNVFLGTMSHELRTPLIGILGYSDILLDDLHVPESIEMVKGIRRGGRRLLNTLNLILDFTRIESDRLEVMLKQMDIVEPLTYAFSEFEGAAREKNLEYSLNILQDNLITNLDEHLFIIVMENLINNAVKFTRKGGIYLTTGINEENKIFVTVRDTGIGIDEKHIDIIFQEFRQVSEGINREYQGTGLGLTITEKYIRMLNGSIEVKSKVGEGTVFTLTFSLALDKTKSS